MSYTGFFAETDLYEVAKGGDGSKGSWVVPVDRADGIAAADFVEDSRPGHRRAEAGAAPRRARSCSGSPAANASSPRRTTPPRC